MMNRNRSLRWLLVGVAVIALIGLIAHSISLTTIPPAKPRVDSAIEPDVLVDHGYVGWKACRECHSNRVEEFQQSRHFHALRLANDYEFPAGVRTGDSFSTPDSPFRFEMTLSPQPAITTFHTSNGRQSKTISPIDFVYGAGAGTDEVFFTRRGDELFEMPVVWLSEHAAWGATAFDPNSPDDPSRPLSPQCLECHTVWVDYKQGTLNHYGTLVPQLLGVTCERCHGPARAHVDHHHANPTDKIAASIVQPKLLSRDRLMDLCAQCHTNSVRHRNAAFSYRPGEPLEESFRPMEVRYPEEDRVANQVRYFKESRCYQNSDTMTCITCHNPHRKADRTDPTASSQSCLSCHQAETCQARSRLPVALQDQCAACHMPRRNKVQVNFETAEGEIVFPAPRFEHRIAIYPEIEMELRFRWLETQTDAQAQEDRKQLRRQLVQHWTQTGNSMQDHRRYLQAIDAFRTALSFGDPTESIQIRQKLAEATRLHKQVNVLLFEGDTLKRERRLDDAIAIFEKLLSVAPENARGHRELGTLLAATGHAENAKEHLHLAGEFDSNDPGPQAMLGWMEYLNGRAAESLGHYLKAREIDPWNAKIDFQIAQCHAQLGRWDESADSLERVLAIDPHHRDACRLIRKIIRERFSAAEALPRAIRAVELTRSEESGLLLTLAETYRDLKRPADAEAVLKKVRQATDPDKDALSHQVRNLEQSLRQPAQ